MNNTAEGVQGWVELLHFNYAPCDFAKARINATSLSNFKASHYTQVGSTLPLSEYDCAIDIYKQFAVEQDPEFNIPRTFNTYDAINLCVCDPKLGNKITTLILLNKGSYVNVSFRAAQIQQHPQFKHCLVIRQEPFKSFAVCHK